MRCHLHFIAGRGEDRLSFDRQPELASRLGYKSHAQGAARGQLFGGKHIALNFGQRDITLRELTVGMEDRVVGILPALVGEPLFGGALIFDKAVLIGVAGAVDRYKVGQR